MNVRTTPATMPAIGGPESDFAPESVVLLFAEETSLDEDVGVDESVGVGETVGVEESVTSVGLVSLGVVPSEEGLLVDEGATGLAKLPVSSLSSSSSVVPDTDIPLGRDDGVSSSGDETVGSVLENGSLEGCDAAGVSFGSGELSGRSWTRSSSSSSSVLVAVLVRGPSLESSLSSSSSPMLVPRKPPELSSSRAPLLPSVLSPPRPVPLQGTSRLSSSSSTRPPVFASSPLRPLSCSSAPSLSPLPPPPPLLTLSSPPPLCPTRSCPRAVSSPSSPPPKNQLINEFGSSDPLPPKEAHGFPLLGVSEVSQNGDMVHRA